MDEVSLETISEHLEVEIKNVDIECTHRIGKPKRDNKKP